MTGRRERITFARRKGRALASVIRRRQMNGCRGERAGAVVRNFCKRGAGALHALPRPIVFTRVIVWGVQLPQGCVNRFVATLKNRFVLMPAVSTFAVLQIP